MDAKEREFFHNIATSFSLPDETADRLIEVGRRLLRESPDYQRFLAAVNGAPTPTQPKMLDGTGTSL
jgi:hypothetical protein